MSRYDLTALRDRTLQALLAMQRRSWEQGLAGHALLALARFDLADVLAIDAVANQMPDGRLADLGDLNVVNGAAALEPVLAMATRDGDTDLAAAAQRQVDWLIDAAPRADDGTLLHVLDRREIWSDTVYMVVPALVAAGRVDLALQQLSGHSRRLQHPETQLFAHIWDEDEQRLTRAGAWGGGNGWVVAGCARAIHLLRPAGAWALPRPATPVDEEFVPSGHRLRPAGPRRLPSASVRGRPVPRHRRRPKHFRGGDAGRDAGVRGVDRRRGRLAARRIRRTSAGPCWRPWPARRRRTGCCVPPAGRPRSTGRASRRRRRLVPAGRGRGRRRTT